MSQNVKHPNEIVNLFKKSGEFDRLRRELLLDFENSDRISHFSERVEEIVTARLRKDHDRGHLFYQAKDSELMQEIERYPIVERAVEDCRLFTDPDFTGGIRENARKLMRGEKIFAPQRFHNGIHSPMTNSRGQSAAASPFSSATDRNPSMTPLHRTSDAPIDAVSLQGFNSPAPTNTAVESVVSSNSTMVDDIPTILEAPPTPEVSEIPHIEEDQPLPSVPQDVQEQLDIDPAPTPIPSPIHHASPIPRQISSSPLTSDVEEDEESELSELSDSDAESLKSAEEIEVDSPLNDASPSRAESEAI